jgi:Flp pilus assembly protein TadG
MEPSANPPPHPGTSRSGRTLAKYLAGTLGRLRENRRGNVAVTVAVMLTPLIFAMGMAADYTLARTRQDRLNGIADTAALAAVTPTMMNQSTATAQAAALQVIRAGIAAVSNVTYNANDITVTVNDTTSGTSVTRVATVNFAAGSTTVFSGVLGMTSLPLSGASSAKSALSPKIDFYLLLDTSPSMAIAATTSGISTMVANTKSQGGCAFGCHETNPASDNLGNPGGIDNYQLARNLGVTLRIDLVNKAVQDLMATAPVTAAQNYTSYRTAIYTIDYNFTRLSPLTSDFTAAKTAAGTVQALTVYNNNCLTVSICNSDEDSYLDMGLQQINSVMPNPGTGTGNAGDTPAEVLFIVTDGVEDYIYNGSRNYGPINTHASWCQTIKNRGIRIAFLYLTYNPLPTNAWYNTYIAPIQPTIATAAQNCASPGLYFQVNTDGDVSGALNNLFQKAVSTAHLVSVS